LWFDIVLLFLVGYSEPRKEYWSMQNFREYIETRKHAYPAWGYTVVVVVVAVFMGDETHTRESPTPPLPLTVEARKAIVPETGWTRIWDEAGKGGPEAGVLSFEDENIQIGNEELYGRPVFITSSGPTTSIERVNFHNYASAILPTTSGEISSDFGWRSPPCRSCSSDHRGVDFVPGNGEPVVSILDGLVTEAGWNGGYGYWVKIEHRVVVGETVEMWESVYAHMQQDSIPENVFIGAVVKRGDLLGKVGNTGVSTGPHLHFELRIDGEHVDPLPLVSPHEATTVRSVELANIGVIRELVIEYR
jgi:hypothetical protein